MGNSTSSSTVPDNHVCNEPPSVLRFLPSNNPAVFLSIDLSTVSFPSYITSKWLVTPVDNPISHTPSCIHFKVQCSGDAQIILGLGKKSLTGPSSEVVFCNTSYANITTGKVYSVGSVTPIPPCINGGIVKACIHPRNHIRYSVHNPDTTAPSPAIALHLDNHDDDPIYPMIGAMGRASGNASVQLLPIGIHMSDPVPSNVRFDTTTAFGPVQISEDGRTVKRNSLQSNCCVAMNQVMREGVHRWTLSVEEDEGCSMCLGISTHPLNISPSYSNTHRQIYNHSGLYLWRSYQGLLYANGRVKERKLVPIDWSPGKPVTVEFVLNLNTGSLEVKRNHVSLGVAFSNVKGPVCPVVVFYAGYPKEVKIMEYVHEGRRRENRSMSVPAPPTQTNPISIPPTQTNPILIPPTQSIPISIPPMQNIPISSPPMQIMPISVPPTQNTPIPAPPFTAAVTSSLPVPTRSPTCGACFENPCPSSCGELTLSRDKCTFERTSDVIGNAYCLLDKLCCPPLIYKWSFLIERDEKASTCIGIASNPVCIRTDDKPVYRLPSMMLCQSFEGRLYYKGQEFVKKRFDPFWYDNSKVEVTLDLKSGVMQYSINDSGNFIAFTRLTGNYKPVVAFYGSGRKKITLLKFETVQCGTSRQMNSIAGMNDLSTSSSETAKDSDRKHRLRHGSSNERVCIVCSVEDNNVAILPCRHVLYCPVHAVIGDKCVVCGETICGVINVF